MSLSKTTLSAIQQAGQGLHKATVVVSAAVREQAEHMVAAVANQPYQAEGEQAFANFKMLARLSQDLQTLEEQLRALYATATELSSPEMDVVVALPRASARARAAALAQNEAAEDAVIKAAPQGRSNPKAKAKAKKAAKSNKPVTLTGNDSKVLDYLKTVLKTDTWTDLTGAAVAQGAAMPLGSVGISLKKVVLAGAVKKTGKGSYQLAA
ncbi:hypothetical protein DIC66_09600 [Rhodoferax lacus]|uniref:Uncharacterized protein n=1 Tax=Rhodoferax lacus TaxID=2184758 RepID=A0A3E1RDC1_9BURK|nr:hypothetical protein [Rhodoferax lacus]RFO97368.1 hypothetical protein DIC66_09600 [Rhodoferax lacus]